MLAPTPALVRGRRGERPSGELVEQFQRGPVGDARQHHGGREQREKTVPRRPPTTPRLAEVLETGEGQDPLPTALGDDAREPGQRRHVGQFIEGEEQPGASFVAVVGRVDELFEQTDDQGGRDHLMATGRDDVQLVGTRQERLDVERRLARGGARRVGAHAREQSRRR